jgi:hypothetical protein
MMSRTLSLLLVGLLALCACNQSSSPPTPAPTPVATPVIDLNLQASINAAAATTAKLACMSGIALGYLPTMPATVTILQAFAALARADPAQAYQELLATGALSTSSLAFLWGPIQSALALFNNITASDWTVYAQGAAGAAAAGCLSAFPTG